MPAAGGHPKPRIPLRLPGLGPSRGLWVRCRAQLTFPVTPAARQGREEGTRSSFLSFTPWAQLFPHRSKGKATTQPAMTPSFTPLPFYFTSPNGVGGTKQSPALFDGLILEPSMLGSNACLTALRGARSTAAAFPPRGLAEPLLAHPPCSPTQLPGSFRDSTCAQERQKESVIHEEASQEELRLFVARLHVLALPSLMASLPGSATGDSGSAKSQGPTHPATRRYTFILISTNSPGHSKLQGKTASRREGHKVKPLTDKDIGFLCEVLAITVTIRGRRPRYKHRLFCKVSLELLAALKRVTESQNCIIDHCLFCRVGFFNKTILCFCYFHLDKKQCSSIFQYPIQPGTTLMRAVLNA